MLQTMLKTPLTGGTIDIAYNVLVEEQESDNAEVVKFLLHSDQDANGANGAGGAAGIGGDVSGCLR
jgi:hypothetical protein